jgi:hypothetical protein
LVGVKRRKCTLEKVFGGGGHEINMVKIPKEGKEIRIKAPIMAGITDCAIKHHKCLFNSYSSRVIFQKNAIELIIPME